MINWLKDVSRHGMVGGRASFFRAGQVMGAVVLTGASLAAANMAAWAADPPAPRPPAQAEMHAAPVYAPGTGPMVLTNPAEAMAGMAESLDKKADAVVLEVEGRPITQGDIADMLRAMPVSMATLGFDGLVRRSLEQLARQKAMVIAAEKLNIDKDPAVRRRLRAASERALAEEWIAQAVTAAVPEAAVRARYDRDVAGKPGPEEVRARVILVGAEDEARSLAGQLQAGADFAETAKRYSRDASKSAGGDLGYVPFDALGLEVRTAMYSLGVGQMTAYPVRTAAGYFIVKIEGRRQRGTPTYEEARGELLRALKQDAAGGVIRAQMAAVKTKEFSAGEKTLPPGK